MTALKKARSGLVAAATMAVACGGAPPVDSATDLPHPRLEPPAELRNVALPPPTFAFSDPERRARLVRALDGLDALVADRGPKLGAAGLFVGVVIDGDLAKWAGYGVQNLETQAPVSEDTVFRIGSLTNAFTASAIMRLHTEQKLSLDLAAKHYVPAIAHLRYPNAEGPELTVRHLLTHTAGLPRTGPYSGDGAIATDVTEADVLAGLADLPLEHPPGEGHRYSDLGYVLLELIIAERSGQRYREYIHEQLFAPLGLASASWEASKSEPTPDGVPRHLAASEGVGGLFLSGADLARFVAWQLDAYVRLDAARPAPITPSVVRAMHQPARTIGFIVEPTGEASPWLADATVYSQGYGWTISRTCDLEHVVHKDGIVDHLSYSDAMMLPRHGVGIVILSNTGSADLTSLRDAVLDLLAVSGALQPRALVASDPQSTAERSAGSRGPCPPRR